MIQLRSVAGHVIGAITAATLLLLPACTDDGADLPTQTPSLTVEASTVTETVIASPGTSAGPAGSVTAASAPATEASATTPEETLERVDLGAGNVRFLSPTGNIFCRIQDLADALCDVRDADWSIPDPGDCAHDWMANRITVTTDGTVEQGHCFGDTWPLDDLPVLEDGQELAIAEFRCVSRETGMTCESVSDGTGFFVSRETYEVF